MIGEVERAVHTARRRLETWRIERQYPSLRPQTMAPQRGFAGQTLAIDAIVRQHCRQGGMIVQMHDTATIKLDAAEYAFSSMLEELKGAMTTLPTNWTPERTQSDSQPAVPALSQAKAA